MFLFLFETIHYLKLISYLFIYNHVILFFYRYYIDISFIISLAKNLLIKYDLLYLLFIYFMTNI